MSSSRGRPPYPDILTPAEWQVLNLVRHGLGNRRIATLRRTSVDAVKFHVANILSKLDASDRSELKAWASIPADSPLADSGGAERSHDVNAPSLGPIGQIAREVSDIRESERWYRDILRLPHLFTFGNLVFFDCGGTRLFLTPPENGTVKPQSVLYFRTDDIQSSYQDLSARGVAFEGAPHLIHRHGDGSEEWMAFFKDPSGHMLALMQRTKPNT
jgi:DNA-binding CsgD family transcriptional regulator/catechol 2,3-dioxygenase-like lactoylglutathione lyase family enzyme